MYLIIFVIVYNGRDQPPPCLERRGEGSTAGVLRLRPPVAGADARYEDVDASSYHRPRPYTQSIGGNVLDNNKFAFVIVVLVDMDTVAAAASAAVVVVGGGDVAAVVVISATVAVVSMV